MELYKKTAKEMMDFIKESPTAFHAIDSIKKRLLENGFQELLESQNWSIVPGGKYFVTRNQSSIIAVDIGEELGDYAFHITASHSDSPTFKVKENAELEVRGHYTQLNTEGYGGMICSSWFDRPLSLAGRVIVKEKDTLKSRLVKIDKDLLLIPNVAIHMNRAINDGMSYNKQIDLLPLLGDERAKKSGLKKMIAEELKIEMEQIKGMDLFLYNRMQPSIWGANEEYISCPQLDDLQCAYASLQGFLNAKNDKGFNVYACFDNEEVGSGTKQGADSTFMESVLKRMNRALGRGEEEFERAVASGMMLSCDNAHAVHPNHPEKTDSNNCVYMNQGIVIKSHAGQKYTSDAVSIALFKEICEKAEVPVQFFANRSDAAGGSTLGNIAMAHISLNSVDIGLPQLAMHSAYETAGCKDTWYMEKAVEQFYNLCFRATDSDTIVIQ